MRLSAVALLAVVSLVIPASDVSFAKGGSSGSSHSSSPARAAPSAKPAAQPSAKPAGGRTETEHSGVTGGAAASAPKTLSKTSVFGNPPPASPNGPLGSSIPSLRKAPMATATLSGGQRLPDPSSIVPVRRVGPTGPRIAPPSLPPRVSFGQVRRNDQVFMQGRFRVYSYGPRFGWFGPHFRGGFWLPGAHPYPYPVLYPDYYDGGQWNAPPDGVWSIVAEFNGQEVEAYWDPYVQGYWYYDDDWGYVCIQ